MSRITLTKSVAYAGGQDAGNASMRKAGRKAWNEDDRNVAAQKTLELMVAGGFLGREQAIQCGMSV